MFSAGRVFYHYINIMMRFDDHEYLLIALLYIKQEEFPLTNPELFDILLLTVDVSDVTDCPVLFIA